MLLRSGSTGGAKAQELPGPSSSGLTESSPPPGSPAMASRLAACVVAFCLLAIGALAADKDVTKLQIGVKFRPATCERKAHNGDTVKVHYKGSLTDGSVFDSSHDRGVPFDFTLGKGMVIKGWDLGILGMCVGEKRKLKIPSDLGYGDNGSPPKIPGGATLIFETELVEIVDAPPANEPEEFGGEDDEGFDGEDGEDPMEE